MLYSKLNKIKKTLKWLIRFALIIAFFAEVYYKSWLSLFITILALILTFGPEIFEKRFKLDLPEEFEIWIIIFIYLTLYLGEVKDFYLLFWWWDILLHGFSAISIGLVGFVIMLSLQQGHLIKAKPFLICLFAFAFAVAAGAIWEIFEFLMDLIFNITMQNNSLEDTMLDIIVDTIGALIGSIFGYIYLKNQKSKWVFPINSFVNLNSSLFKKIEKSVSKNYKNLKI
jgi:hypothetical protein